LIERDRTVFRFVRERALPVVVTLGGGYSDPIEQTVVAHANTFRAAAAVLQPILRAGRLF
jgi:acetoin utilization deacetylase AcuC-like enzyme